MDALDELERGRESYATGARTEAHASLSHAAHAAALAPEDLEQLATSAYMLGRDGDYLSGMERAHHAYRSARRAGISDDPRRTPAWDEV